MKSKLLNHKSNIKSPRGKKKKKKKAKIQLSNLNRDLNLTHRQKTKQNSQLLKKQQLF